MQKLTDTSEGFWSLKPKIFKAQVQLQGCDVVWMGGWGVKLDYSRNKEDQKDLSRHQELGYSVCLIQKANSFR